MRRDVVVELKELRLHGMVQALDDKASSTATATLPTSASEYMHLVMLHSGAAIGTLRRQVSQAANRPHLVGCGLIVAAIQEETRRHQG